LVKEKNGLDRPIMMIETDPRDADRDFRESPEERVISFA
jgi:hypothetical protein